jgi:hypothetical protein
MLRVGVPFFLKVVMDAMLECWGPGIGVRACHGRLVQRAVPGLQAKDHGSAHQVIPLVSAAALDP